MREDGVAVGSSHYAQSALYDHNAIGCSIHCFSALDISGRVAIYRVSIYSSRTGRVGSELVLGSVILFARHSPSIALALMLAAANNGS